MIHFEFRKIDTDTSGQLIELSRNWVEENCSHGMVTNEISDLREPLVVAVENSRIIGYLFGHYYKQESRTSYIEPDSDCFSVDELYVLPSYRNRGIGKKLYRMMEDRVKENCSYITLATSTKDYKSILNLYVEQLHMDFHSAFLIKCTNSVQEGSVCE